jgi:hypothetical protein
MGQLLVKLDIMARGAHQRMGVFMGNDPEPIFRENVSDINQQGGRLGGEITKAI